MRIFVYEYTCTLGAGDRTRAGSLTAEGWAMLTAVLEDLARVPGVEAVTLLAEDCPEHCAAPVGWCSGPQDEAAIFRRLAQSADYTLVIAPEFDNLLVTRCRWVEEAGGRLLGPTSAAVQRTADKWALARHWQDRGVPTPPCQLVRPGETLRSGYFPVVWKPRYGAGSQATFLIRDAEEARDCAAKARLEGFSGEALVQPFIPGRPASVAILLGPRTQLPLPAAAQHLSADGRFRYLGGSLPLPPALAERAQRLAVRAVQGVPGLQGYVGVDLILGEVADGSQDWVIEINPRLTTSYVGLRALSETNLAELMLCLVEGGELPRLSWRTTLVDFEANGRVRCIG
ncbi:MAG: ATP-grasp domain-containing protein [Gemmataceae bacterium]|nr:ATP-grasp domain-containing protein [Gemmataceae bacterium]